MLTLVTMATLSVAAANPPAIMSERLYVGVDRPVMVTLGEPDHGPGVALALMEADGELVVPPRPSVPGRINVAQVLPEIWSIRRTCYLQCLHDNQPVGSALVIQPLLSRPTMHTKQIVRPDGSTYTGIAGWGPPPTDQDADEPATDADQVPEPPRTFSGFRIYPERDILLRTSLGDIVLALRPDESPNTAWNFRHLAAGRFYDGVVFHRVVPLTRAGDPFVIQSGDPTGGGDGGPGYPLPMEPSGLRHEFGVISMARSDHPDSAGSQFFICLSRAGTARLDGQYCAFGYAIEGATIIRAIAAVELADVASGRPVDPPVVVTAQLIPSPPRTPGAGRPDRPVAEDDAVLETPLDRIPR
ncbi:MAG: peptidylprolyl isomerase [Planctomycetota bacterium]|jgi:peptidyl-prolyl cis-trans isomerase B (cyclophilin B)